MNSEENSSKKSTSISAISNNKSLSQNSSSSNFKSNSEPVGNSSNESETRNNENNSSMLKNDKNVYKELFLKANNLKQNEPYEDNSVAASLQEAELNHKQYFNQLYNQILNKNRSSPTQAQQSHQQATSFLSGHSNNYLLNQLQNSLINNNFQLQNQQNLFNSSQFDPTNSNIAFYLNNRLNEIITPPIGSSSPFSTSTKMGMLNSPKTSKDSKLCNGNLDFEF